MNLSSRVALCATLTVVTVAPDAHATDVLTWHNDNARTGQNLTETQLTPSAVRMGGFGKLFSDRVKGYVYAQPLYRAAVANIAGGTHDVVFVATEHDLVYAFDANAVGDPLWQVNLADASQRERPVRSHDVECTDLVPEIGITSTPVIDAATGTIYVVAKSKGALGVVQRLHALDITNGAERPHFPVTIDAAVAGDGDGNDGGMPPMVHFDPLREGQRAALLLAGNVVYIAWASHCDVGPYHGWVIGYDETDGHQAMVFNATPDGGLGGIWQSGGGLAADDDGNIYFETGNGTFDADMGGRDYGDSLVKIAPDGSVLDWFTASDQQVLNDADIDYGSGGPVLLPDQPMAPAHLVVTSGKEGTIFLGDRDDLGHFHGSDQVVQELFEEIGGTWSLPAFWNDVVYYGGSGDSLKAYPLTGGQLVTPPSSSAPDGFGFPGSTPSISASGTSGAVLWALQTDGFMQGRPAILHAYDATDLTQELYRSDLGGSKQSPGGAVKFTVPTIADGKVFVGARKRLSVYGLP
ncbi:MAG TPA: pyrrolo-quinoline quinone [Candidatus Binatia bacterium]|jgi:hypothetical protein